MSIDRAELGHREPDPGARDRGPGGGARFLFLLAAGLGSLLLWGLPGIPPLFLATMVFVLGVPLGLWARQGSRRWGAGTALLLGLSGWLVFLLLATSQVLQGRLPEEREWGWLAVIVPLYAGAHFLALGVGVAVGALWMEAVQEQDRE